MTAYRAILADPPWRYRNFSDAVHGAAIAHYDGMGEQELAAVPVASWAAEDAALFCWATWPKLDEAMRVVAAWGFEYVTAIPWVKVLPEARTIYRGIGFWSMSASEVLLIARRGSPKRAKIDPPVIGLLTGEPRVFYAPRTKHSAKPLEVHAWIEAMFPGGPFLELFARRERGMWTAWGNELGFRLSAAGVEPCVVPSVPLPLFDGAP